ncbi:MAG TPA: hypothetical protein VMZ22_13280 [Acidimicrobiales bacterium]|nr:hypothetical protein [Acidimicrobiales bacterium]
MVHRIIGLVAALLFFFGVATYFEVAEEPVAVGSRPHAVLASVQPGPGINVAAIAAWRATALVRPKSPPPGWTMVFADVLPAAQTIEGCHQFELDYQPPVGAGYLYLYQLPNTCAKPLAGEAVSPFTAGRYRGSATNSAQDGSVVQITIGAATLQAQSDLSLVDLAKVLDDFVPLRVGASRRD